MLVRTFFMSTPPHCRRRMACHTDNALLQDACGIGGLLACTESSLLALGSSLAHAYYHCDGNGNVTCLINASNAVVARYTYDPFGNVLSMSGALATANLYRFSSKEVHPNSGLVYYLYRYYDANLQRWLNRDPIQEKGGINLAAFVLNAPLDLEDPLGLAGDVNLGKGYSCRVDSFNTGGSASHEIHVCQRAVKTSHQWANQNQPL